MGDRFRPTKIVLLLLMRQQHGRRRRRPQDCVQVRTAHAAFTRLVAHPRRGHEAGGGRIQGRRGRGSPGGRGHLTLDATDDPDGDGHDEEDGDGGHEDEEDRPHGDGDVEAGGRLLLGRRRRPRDEAAGGRGRARVDARDQLLVRHQNRS